MGKTSEESQLKTFIKGDVYETAVGDSEEEVKVLELTCPRASCAKTFIVVWKDYWKLTDWDKRVKKQFQKRPSRACPYCYRAGRMPTKKG